MLPCCFGQSPPPSCTGVTCSPRTITTPRDHPLSHPPFCRWPKYVSPLFPSIFFVPKGHFCPQVRLTPFRHRQTCIFLVFGTRSVSTIRDPWPLGLPAWDRSCPFRTVDKRLFLFSGTTRLKVVVLARLFSSPRSGAVTCHFSPWCYGGTPARFDPCFTPAERSPPPPVETGAVLFLFFPHFFTALAQCVHLFSLLWRLDEFFP